MDLNELVDIFKLYPKIFPRGYFRFLKKTLSEKINKKEIIYEKGVLLTWTEYKKKTKISPSISINKGEIKINQLVNKNQGNNMAKEIFVNFLKTKKTNMFLTVKKDNKRAIRFYELNDFKKIGEKIMGKNIICLIMKRNISDK